MHAESRAEGPGTNGSYFLKRKEDKYEMPLGAATFLREEIERHLPLFEFRKGHRYTYITTVYFDTEKLEFYQRAKSFYDDNLKIRVKEYYYQQSAPAFSPLGSSQGKIDAAANGSPWLTFDCCFVEIKQRLRGLVVKRRFEMPKRLLGRLLRGEDVWDELIASRSGIEFNGFVDVYREFRYIVQRYHLFPKSIINYRRSVYQQDEHELRITFDDEIAVYEARPRLYEETASLARCFLGKPKEVFSYVIMEIKCQDGYPDWMGRILQTHAPKRLSKFTRSLNVLTQEIPELAPPGSLKDTHLGPAPGAPSNGTAAGAGEGAAGSGEDTKEVSDLRL